MNCISDPVFLQGKKQLVRKMQSEFRTFGTKDAKRFRTFWSRKMQSEFRTLTLFARQRANLIAKLATLFILLSQMSLNFFRRFRQLERKQRLLITIAFTLIILTVLSVSAFASYHYFSQARSPQIDSNLINLDEEILLGLDQVPEEDRETLNVLLAGYGGPGHQGGFLSDVIQIAHFNFPKKTITFISIPRDLYMPDGNKVNALLSRGMKSGKVEDGLALMQKSLSQITGLPIKYYIGIDFVGFKRTIGNELGSIEVEVSQTLDDPWYPLDGEQLNPCGYSAEEIAQMTANLSGFALESKFACRYEHLRFEKGLVKMEGHEALAYVRSRHSSSDYDRSRRQVEVLDAIRRKLFSLEALQHVSKFHQALSKHVSTNLDLESAKYLAPLLVDADSFSITSINLSPENVLQSSKSSTGAFIVIPKAGSNNWTELREFIKKQL